MIPKHMLPVKQERKAGCDKKGGREPIPASRHLSFSKLRHYSFISFSLISRITSRYGLISFSEYPIFSRY